MFGKAATHLLRLCGILHVLKESIKFLKINQIVDRNSRILTNEFIESVESEFRKNAIDITKISAETVSQAHNLLIYLNINRVILANYDIDLKMDFYQAIEIFLKNSRSKKNYKKINSANHYYICLRRLCVFQVKKLQLKIYVIRLENHYLNSMMLVWN